MTRWMLIGLLALAATARIARADWTEPADGKITEDELKNYIAATNDWAVENAKIAQRVAAASTDAEKIAAIQDISKDHDDCIQKHHLTGDENTYVGGKAMEAFGAVTYLDDVYAKSRTDADAKAKDEDARLAEAQKRLETFQAAQKDGKRILSADDRDSIIKAAQGDQQSALDEVKQHKDEIKSAQDDEKTHGDDAKTDDDLAKNPPSDVSAADHDSYVAGKKADAQSERDAAKEAKGHEDDAKKAMDDAQARADIAAAKIKNPEIPLTDDEKAQVKSDNEAGISQAQSDISSIEQEKDAAAALEAEMKKQSDEISSKTPKENIDLMRKYKSDFKASLEHLSGAMTQPTG